MKRTRTRMKTKTRRFHSIAKMQGPKEMKTDTKWRRMKAWWTLFHVSVKAGAWRDAIEMIAWWPLMTSHH